MAEPLLSVRGLVVEARAGLRSVDLIRGLDLELHAGEALGLAGESGAGKSLTARALMGLLPAGVKISCDSQIRWRGQDLSGLNERQWRRLRGSQVALIPQNPMTALNPIRSIGSQMRYLSRLHRGPAGRAAAKRACIQTLTRLGIAEAERVLSLYPHQLSGGMSQRILIAMAMLCRPGLLIADEVTSMLDVTTQISIVEALTEVCRESGTALLMISHDLGMIARCCDRAAVMYAGQVVEQAAIGLLFARPRHPYTAGLLAAVPDIGALAEGRLRPVEGQPPNLNIFRRAAHSHPVAPERPPTVASNSRTWWQAPSAIIAVCIPCADRCRLSPFCSAYAPIV